MKNFALLCFILILNGVVAAESSYHKKNLRNLVELEGYGGEPDDDKYPLHHCAGDCDYDEHVSLIVVRKKVPCRVLRTTFSSSSSRERYQHN